MSPDPEFTQEQIELIIRAAASVHGITLVREQTKEPHPCWVWFLVSPNGDRFIRPQGLDLNVEQVCIRFEPCGGFNLANALEVLGTYRP